MTIGSEPQPMQPFEGTAVFEGANSMPGAPAVETIPELESANKPFLRKMGEVGVGLYTEFKESNHKAVNIATGIATLGTQAVDRARVSVVLVPTVALDTYKATNSPLLTGLAAAGAFGGWCIGVGGVLTEGLAQYPKTVNTVNENFPGFVSLFEDALPGINPNEATHEHSLARRIGSSILTHTRRGWTAVGIGNSAYVGTATAKGRSKRKVHELSAVSGADGGVAAGVIAGGLAGVVKVVGESDPTLALRIVHDASNVNIWYGLAGFLMSTNFIATRFKRRQERKQSQEIIETKTAVHFSAEVEPGTA